MASDGGINADIVGLRLRQRCDKIARFKNADLQCAVMHIWKLTHVSSQLRGQSGHLLLRGIQFPTKFSDLLDGEKKNHKENTGKCIFLPPG